MDQVYHDLINEMTVARLKRERIRKESDEVDEWIDNILTCWLIHQKEVEDET